MILVWIFRVGETAQRQRRLRRRKRRPATEKSTTWILLLFPTSALENNQNIPSRSSGHPKRGRTAYVCAVGLYPIFSFFSFPLWAQARARSSPLSLSREPRNSDTPASGIADHTWARDGGGRSPSILLTSAFFSLSTAPTFFALGPCMYRTPRLYIKLYELLLPLPAVVWRAACHRRNSSSPKTEL